MRPSKVETVVVRKLSICNLRAFECMVQYWFDLIGMWYKRFSNLVFFQLDKEILAEIVAINCVSRSHRLRVTVTAKMVMLEMVEEFASQPKLPQLVRLTRFVRVVVRVLVHWARSWLCGFDSQLGHLM